MSRKGNCFDNALVESYFGHLKDELYCNITFPTVDALTTAINTCISLVQHRTRPLIAEGPDPVQY
ncbi:IS3 family transposase [Rhodococcus sp. GB-02]